MFLEYFVDGVLKATDCSNDDVTISFKSDSNRIVEEICALKNIELKSAQVSYNHNYSREDRFFLNGYQSWTDSFEYFWKDKLRNVKKLPAFLLKTFAFDKYGDGFFYEYQAKVFHGFDISYITGLQDVFIANNNFKTAYLIIEHHKNKNLLLLKSDVEGLKLEAGQAVAVFDYIMSKDINQGKELYFSQFEPPSAKKMFGYTSWYNHYQNITEQIILDALDSHRWSSETFTNGDRGLFLEPFELFQIDDGYEEYVGDWLKIDAKKFPNGLKLIVDKAHNKGMKAGIWLAPFAVEEKSAVFKEHPDWLCINKDGKPLKCGSNWSGFYSLNIMNPSAVDYIKKFLSYYVQLGFDFFKLDFLYAASIMAQPGYTRAQVAQKAYDILRSELNGKLILGCGAVVSNTFGLFDYLRVGPDVSLIFDDIWYMRKMHRERISTKVTLRNTIFRHLFDGKVFLNDPDVFLLRSSNIKLSKQQRQALTIINALFGSLLMTSDNPKDYNQQQLAYLNECLYLFRNAKVVNVKSAPKTINITYMIDGQTKTIEYNVKKGIVQ